MNIKKFFEQIESKIKQTPNKKEILNEEDKKNINIKINDMKIFLFNKNNDNFEKKKREKNTLINYLETPCTPNNPHNYNNKDNKDEISDETILIMIDNIETIDEMENVFKFCKNLYQLLNIILLKFENIVKIYKKNKKTINIDELFGIEINSFEKIKQIHELLLRKEKEKKYYLINFEKMIYKYINFFQNRNINNLLLLKEMINNHKNYGNELKGLLMNIKGAIKKSILFFIRGKQLNSIQIIDIILNLGIEYIEGNEKEIFKSINIYDLKENDYPKFSEICYKMFNNQHIIYIFIKTIFNQIETIKDFGMIYKLIPNYIFDVPIAKELETKFQLLLNYTYDNNSSGNILNIIYKTLEIFNSINYPVNNFLNIIDNSRNFSTKMISEFCLRVIQDKNLNQNNEINNFVFNFIIYRNIINNINVINSLIKIIISSEKNIIKLFFANIKNLVINEEDFYNPNMINKFKLYIIIYPNFQNYHDSEYFKISNSTLNKIYKKIIKLELNYNEFNRLIEELDKKDFQEKLICFNILRNKLDRDKKIYNIIKQNNDKLNIVKIKLINTENFFKTFFDKDERNYLKKINEQKQILFTKTIDVILKKLEKFFNESEQYKSYKDYFKLIDSIFFMALYNQNKLQENIGNQKDLFKKNINDFLILEILNNLNDDLNINNIPFKDIIIIEIKKIIEKFKKDKKYGEEKCLKIIKNDLNIINEINIISNKLNNNNNLRNNNDNLLDNFEKEKNLIFNLFILF